MPVTAIGKCLSDNDVGDTGSHRSGLLIPKNPTEVRDFFPPLDPAVHNPDALIRIVCESTGAQHTIRYIYYNGKTLKDADGAPLSGRDEYRLTRTTQLFRDLGIGSCDALILRREDDGNIYVTSSIDEFGATIPRDGSWAVVTA